MKMAKAQGADIYFGDAAYIRSDHHAGRTWGKRGETPIVQATGARYGISLIQGFQGAARPMGSGAINAFAELIDLDIVQRAFLIVIGEARASRRTYPGSAAETATRQGLCWLWVTIDGPMLT